MLDLLDLHCFCPLTLICLMGEHELDLHSHHPLPVSMASQKPTRPSLETTDGPTRGVTVSTSAFLACHQCCCAGSSFAWGLNLRALVCGIF